MDATLQLLLPDQGRAPELLATAVSEGGGLTTYCRFRRRMAGVHGARIEITYAHPRSLLPILTSLGRLAGVAICGFDLRKSAALQARQVRLTMEPSRC